MKDNVCFWYSVCPMKRFYETGRLDEFWVREYCWKSNPDCVRKQMDARGEYHPDNMLPDGSFIENLG